MQPVQQPPLALSGKKHAAPWVEVLFGLAAMSGLLWINQGVGFALSILLLPILGEWLQFKGSGHSGIGVAIALVPMGLLLLPISQGMMFALYGLLAAWLLSPWTPVRSVKIRCLIWGVMAMGMLLYLLAQGYIAYRAAYPDYTGSLLDFLADWFTATIAQSPQGNEVLLAAYQAGYARYGLAGEALPAYRVGTLVVFPNEVREQLLLSLRHTAWSTMQASVPMMVIVTGGLVAMGTALLAARLRRKREQPCDVPPFPLWHLPRGWGLGIGLLVTGYLLQIGKPSPAVGYLAVVMISIFRFVYTIQGIAAAHFLLKRMGFRSIGTALITVVGLWLMPDLFQFIGLFDQISPWRGLRKKQREGT